MAVKRSRRVGGDKKSSVTTEDSSPYVPQRDKLKLPVRIHEFEWTDKQKKFIELATDKKTKFIICRGVSGTSKSLLSVYCGLRLLNKKAVSEMVYIRTPCESSSFGLGYLKGDLEDKFAPYNGPLEDKMNELLIKPDIKRLLDEGRVVSKPIGFVRGASFKANYIICEESQNFKLKNFLLLMTRLGKFSKMIFIGDESQSDISGSSLKQVYDLFDDEESKGRGIHTFKFEKEDIMREEVLSFVIDKFENVKK